MVASMAWSVDEGGGAGGGARLVLPVISKTVDAFSLGGGALLADGTEPGMNEWLIRLLFTTIKTRKRKRNANVIRNANLVSETSVF